MIRALQCHWFDYVCSAPRHGLRPLVSRGEALHLGWSLCRTAARGSPGVLPAGSGAVPEEQMDAVSPGGSNILFYVQMI